MNDFWEEMNLKLPRKFIFTDSLSVLAYNREYFIIQLSNSGNRVTNIELKRKDFKKAIKKLEKSLSFLEVDGVFSLTTKNKDVIKIERFPNYIFCLTVENGLHELHTTIVINKSEVKEIIKGLKELKD